MSLLISPDLAYGGLMDVLRSNDRREHQALARASQLYDNLTEPEWSNAMSPSDYQNKKRCWAPVALTSVIVDKIASALYGNRGVFRSTGDTTLDKILQPVWADMGRVMTRVSKVASIGGNDTVKVTSKYPSRVKYGDYGIGNVVPLLDPADPHGRPLGLIFEYLTGDMKVSDQIAAYMRPQKTSVHRVVEIVTRNVRNDDGEIIEPGVHRLFVDEREVNLGNGGYNPMGDFLGNVYWRSADHPTSPFGRSDIIPLIKTLDAINTTICLANEKLVWNVFAPIWTNVRGKIELRFAPGEIWQAQQDDAKLERIDTDPDVTPVLDLVNFLVSMVHETSRVPSVSTGDLEHIGNLSSGRAFEISMIPLVDLLKEKEACAISQEKELVGETIAWMAYSGLIGGFTVPSPIRGLPPQPDAMKIAEIVDSTVIEFTPITYPHTATEQVQYISSAVDKGLMSKEEGIGLLHPTWDEGRIRGKNS